MVPNFRHLTLAKRSGSSFNLQHVQFGWVFNIPVARGNESFSPSLLVNMFSTIDLESSSSLFTSDMLRKIAPASSET